MAVTVVKNRVEELLRASNALTKLKCYVGIPGDAPARQPEDEGDTPPSNALIGYVQEFGEPDLNIPARPFLHPGIEAAMPQIEPRLRAMGRAALEGDLAAIQQGYTAVGLIAQNAVRAQITDGDFAPLAEATLEARRRRGRTGTKPLIDTAQLRNSVTFVVK